MAVIGREAARAPLTSADINDGIVGAIDLQSTLDLSSKTITMPSIASLDVAGNLTVDTSTLYVDATNNRVGVGTTSPVSALDVSQSGDLVSSGLSITRSGANRGSIYLNSSDDTLNISRGATGAIAISASGNVGIGTSSIDYQASNRTVVHIEGSAGALLALEDTGAKGYFFQSGNDLLIENDTASGNMIFGTNSSTERMRIDASGNLLVGKTSTNTLGTVGHDFGVSGYVMHTRAASNVLYLNRTTNDGNIAEFYKDGTTVGSIGTDTSRFKVKSSSLALYLENESNKQLVWGNVSSVPYFYPQSDNDTNLGYPTQRFKDLYLSGGVYLGGTGTANLLDDYETGGWTPEIADAASGGNTGSATASRVIYTKVGRLVTVSAQFLNVDTTGMTAGSQLYIRGLPFASASANIAFGSIQTDNLTFRTSRTQIVPMIVASESFLTIKNIGDGLSDLTTLVSDVSSGTTDIYFSITYQAA